jgi:hypothetical protein
LVGGLGVRIIGIVNDDPDITQLFHDALRENVDGISVLAFNDPVKAFEHFTENKKSYACYFRFEDAGS